MSSTSPTIEEAQQSATKQTGLRSRLFSAIAVAVREPLFHFLLIGVVLFAVYGCLNRGTAATANYQIVLTLDDLKQLAVSFVSQWHRQPTLEEFRGLMESFIRQEVLYREGLAMGLDKDDTIVKRRMAQKMEFLSEDMAGAHEPTTQELKAWFAQNSQKFSLPHRATFRHLFFGFDRRGQKAQTAAATTLAKIAGKPEDSPLAKSLADPFMFQDYYGDRAPEQLAKEFGPNFATAIFKLKPSSWQGPVESGYGWHLVWIESISPGRVPAFEEVEPEVKTAWLADQKAEQWRAAYEKVRAKYEVITAQPPLEKEQGRDAAPAQVAP
jgi:peptidyl-prolyl cis-trans isomerase C